MTEPPTPLYTEATVELVGRAAYLADWPAATEPDWPLLPANERKGYREQAQAVLNALVKAGLLLPEGAETRTEWGWDCGHPRAPQRTCVHPGSEEWARATAAQVWPDGALRSRWIAETPWAAEGGGVADQSKDHR